MRFGSKIRRSRFRSARSVPPGKGLSNRSGKIHRNEKETVFLSWQGSFYEYTVCVWTFNGSTVFESMWTPLSVNVILIEPKSIPDIPWNIRYWLPSLFIRDINFSVHFCIPIYRWGQEWVLCASLNIFDSNSELHITDILEYGEARSQCNFHEPATRSDI